MNSLQIAGCIFKIRHSLIRIIYTARNQKFDNQWDQDYNTVCLQIFANAILGIALASIVIAFLRAIQVERNNFERDLGAANDEAETPFQFSGS